MKVLTKPFLALTFLASAALTTFAQTPNSVPPRLDGKPDNSPYREMVAKIKAGDAKVDFSKFRRAYLDWVLDECNQSDAPDRKKMVDAFEAKDHKAAIPLALVVLEYEYANRGLHLALADAYEKTGDKEKAAFHNDIAKRLRDGLLNSGDGKAPATAYQVLSIREEYQVMAALGYKVSSQSLVMDKQYGIFDVLAGTNAEGKTGSFYFNITDVWVGSTSSKPCTAAKKK
ncbi:MAG: hypothetical protein UZ17_ACD001002299 [Acidobacteria bacterium OLB17]|nr:MAG: hypothetical protein UZ17_ACD001002299 [Acidobacteria bacterium OLB17]MCZ2389791.1 DUF4919 domain-containing protein [Acidobacteriota bacterium]